MSSRIITFKQAILEAQEEALKDPSVILIGEGVPDPKEIFGTTKGLAMKFPSQVFDMPVSENGITGVSIGAAINGLRPILVHQRMDFSLYSMDQIVNNAAKWFSMYGGQGGSVPIVIRMIIGRGWGAGNQHSQNLTALFAHIPGLKIFFPTNARDAFNLFIEAVKDPNPVLFIEHRWLYETTASMNNIAEEKEDAAAISILAIGHTVIEAKKAKEAIKDHLKIRVIEIQKIRPLFPYDISCKMNKFIITEDAWSGGIAAELGMSLYECGAKNVFRIICPNYPSASSPALTKNYYVSANKIIKKIEAITDLDLPKVDEPEFHDVPDIHFRGPF